MALTIEFPTGAFQSGPFAIAKARVAGISKNLWALTLVALALSATAVAWNLGVSAPEPELVEPSGVNVVIRPGDTYWSIAAESMNHVDRRSAVADLTALNGPALELRVGDVVAIPASE